MPHAFAWLAAAFVAGIACGIALVVPPLFAAALMLAALAGAVRARSHGRSTAVLGLAIAGWAAGGSALGSHAERLADAPPLRAAVLRGEAAPFPGAAPARGAPAGGAERDRVVSLVGRLRQDATIQPHGVGLSLAVEEVVHASGAVRVAGGALLTVLGTRAPARADEWRAGRRLRVSAVVRAPARYLDPGVPDLPRVLARRGTALVGSVKSAALVEVLASGSWADERASKARHRVRGLVRASVGAWDATSAAIVTAILIGDRAGLDDRLERDLQAAGTYHVIAISGGNIAILAGLLLGVCRLLLVPWRSGLLATVVLLIAYAQLAGGGSSVARATTMAVVYLSAGLIDQRTSPASALAIAAALILAAEPLALVDAAFLLTFGATIAIVWAVPALTSGVPGSGLLRPAVALLAASVAAEAALLPLGPLFFSRVTVAGLVCNFAAVPLMSVVQVGGMAAVAIAALVPSLGHAAGWLPHEAARLLVSSSGLVHVAPWLTWRVPAPGPWLLAVYYAALIALATSRTWAGWTVPLHRLARRAVAAALVASALLVTSAPLPAWTGGTWLRLMVLDVGQGDATLVRLPTGLTLLVDAGGLGGSTHFDIGERVVAPALWRLGVRRLDVLALTHGDADHVGGAAAMLEIFRPREVWEGVPVPRDGTLAALIAHADAQRVPWRTVQAGDLLRDSGVTVRAWHPPPPDWERQRVRNDDSLVLEIRYGDVSIVLPGDIGAEIERRLAASIPPAPVRVLKAPHHGSASSNSPELLAALRPQVAIVSCGRGNRFGHPPSSVLARYAAAGATVYRTDLHGAITVETDGKTVNVTPFVAPLPASPLTPARAIADWLRATQFHRP